jgi:hypothetical protein
MDQQLKLKFKDYLNIKNPQELPNHGHLNAHKVAMLNLKTPTPRNILAEYQNATASL